MEFLGGEKYSTTLNIFSISNLILILSFFQPSVVGKQRPSKFKTRIAEILKSEGYIIDYEVKSEQNKPNLHISLKYSSGTPVISSIERVSKPGRRIFSSAESLPKVNNGLGIAIISTPKGVMTDIDARKQKVGGEIICKVF